MNSLAIESLPSVALDFMNHDHAEAADLINQLHQQLTRLIAGDSQDRDSVTGLLEAVYSHNKAHFAHEEAEMQRTDFPAYDCHRREHERVLQEMHEIQQQWLSGMEPRQLLVYLHETVVPWLVNHINTMDQVTAMFISRQG